MNEVTNTEKKNEQTAEDLEKQLKLEKNRCEEYLNQAKYLQADLENLRKRCDRQIQQVMTYGNERLVIQLLEVADELEMAVKNAQTTSSTQILIDVVQMTLKHMRKVLEQEGVTPIESKDRPFDPTKHNAIAAEERENTEGCTVVEEVRKGYMMKDKVVRPSIVKVAMKKSSESQNKEENSSESS